MTVPLPVSLATWVIEGRLTRDQADTVWEQLRHAALPDTVSRTAEIIQRELERAGVDMEHFPGAERWD